jgi:hypothetical protein
MPRIEVSTLVSHRDGSPRIEIYTGLKGRDRVQMSVDEARNLALNILQGCEAAVQDAFMIDFAKTKLEADDRMAASLLSQFRQMRRDRQDDLTG